MRRTRILLIPDDAPDSQAIRRLLENQGYLVDTGGFETPFTQRVPRPPDLVLLNIASPSPAIVQCVHWLRSQVTSPLLLATDEIGAQSLLNLFNGAVDDFLTKPFRIREAELRIRKTLHLYGDTSTGSASVYPFIERRSGRDRRRASRKPPTRNRDIQPTVFLVDQESRQIHFHGTALALAPKEYQLLRSFLLSPGRVFSDREILHLLWPDRPSAGANDVQQYVHRVRRKIEADPGKPIYLITVKGFGYRFCLDALRDGPVPFGDTHPIA